MAASTMSIEELILQTDASGAPVRLEYVRGRTPWEASPSSRHQKALQRIERSIRPSQRDAPVAPISRLLMCSLVSPTPNGRSSDRTSPSFVRSRRIATRRWTWFPLQWSKSSVLAMKTKTWDLTVRRSTWNMACSTLWLSIRAAVRRSTFVPLIPP